MLCYRSCQHFRIKAERLREKAAMRELQLLLLWLLLLPHYFLLPTSDDNLLNVRLIRAVLACLTPLTYCFTFYCRAAAAIDSIQ